MCALGAILECCCMDRFVCCVFRSPTDYSMKFHTHCIAVGNLTCGRAHTNKAVHTITHQSEKSGRAVNDCQDRKGAGLWRCQSFVTDAGCKIPHSQVYCYEKSNDQIQWDWCTASFFLSHFHTHTNHPPESLSNQWPLFFSCTLVCFSPLLARLTSPLLTCALLRLLCIYLYAQMCICGTRGKGSCQNVRLFDLVASSSKRLLSCFMTGTEGGFSSSPASPQQSIIPLSTVKCTSLIVLLPLSLQNI